MGEPSPEQLARYFHLDDRDRTLLEPRRHAHTRLGFALKLCTVRFLGTYLSDPTDVPHNVVLTLASQLNIVDLTVLSRYREGEMRYDHVHEIMAEYGYRVRHNIIEHLKRKADLLHRGLGEKRHGAFRRDGKEMQPFQYSSATNNSIQKAAGSRRREATCELKWVLSTPRGLSNVPKIFGNGSLEQDGPLCIVAMEEEEQARLMHQHRLGKR